MTSPRRFEHDLPVLLADCTRRRRPITEMTSSSGSPACGSDRHGRSLKGGSRWTSRPRLCPAQRGSRGGSSACWRSSPLCWPACSRLRRLAAAPPEPFGPAANGALVFAADSDILSADPVTSRTATPVNGPEIDSVPIWSRDGTRFVFRRQLKSTGDPGV